MTRLKRLTLPFEAANLFPILFGGIIQEVNSFRHASAAESKVGGMRTSMTIIELTIEQVIAILGAAIELLLQFAPAAMVITWNAIVCPFGTIRMP